MLSTAALTRREARALSDLDCACEEARRRLAHVGAVPAAADVHVFGASLRLKLTLDKYEAEAHWRPSRRALAILVNCEYTLFVLNQATPLHVNPFLSHWVEAIQRLEARSTQPEPTADAVVTSAHIDAVRRELIKALLESRDPTQFARTSPRQLLHSYVTLRRTSPFAISLYIRMLEDEGIYDRTCEPPAATPLAHVEPAPENSPEPDTAASQPVERLAGSANGVQTRKLQLLSQLQSDRETAIHTLTHLPIKLADLDFLTSLLVDKTLQTVNIDPAPVIADYIQHALRLMEQMGQPPAPTGGEAENDDAGDLLESGRHAQTAAAKLLLLFLRSSIRQALLPLDSLHYSIEEICVRYVWIREVREFRAFWESMGDRIDEV